MMTQDEMKKAAAEAALEYVQSRDVVGVGTGSTVNFFIDALARIKGRIDGAVSSSRVTEERLRKVGIPVLDLNSVNALPVYVDGADESDSHKRLIKGGGGALTREKIVAAVSEKFICIVDEGKLVKVLGKFPLPIEVIPMARAHVSRQLARMGGIPEYRSGFVTDNGNHIIDVHNLEILDPVRLETEINQIAGVVTVGLFARRGADVLVVGGAQGVRVIN